MVKKLGVLILFYTPLAIVTLPIYLTYLVISDRKFRKEAAKLKEIPDNQLPPPGRNNYGVDL